MCSEQRNGQSRGAIEPQGSDEHRQSLYDGSLFAEERAAGMATQNISCFVWSGYRN